jgi:hypothetical protein
MSVVGWGDEPVLLELELDESLVSGVMSTAVSGSGGNLRVSTSESYRSYSQKKINNQAIVCRELSEDKNDEKVVRKDSTRLPV